MKKVLLIILWVIVLWAIAYIVWPQSLEVITDESVVVENDATTTPWEIERPLSGNLIESGDIEQLSGEAL